MQNIKKKVSMQDIADKIGVSKCAVSIVLNGKAKEKRIGDDMAKRILQTAKEMNYEPNELARGLRTGSTKTLGVIVADISNEFFGELVYHIQQKANSYDYSVIIANSNEDPDRMLRMINLLVNRRVDGIIMVPSNNSLTIANKIVSRSIPLVQVDRYLPGIEASYVVLDNFAASANVTERLCRQGCKRIAMFKHKTSALNGRLEGYESVMKAHGYYDETLVKNIDYTNESQDVESAVAELFAPKRKIDAVFFQSHELFLLGIRFIRNMGIDIKKSLKVACFDKIDAFSLVDFPMTYVEQPIKEIGEEAVNILLEHIQNDTEVQRKVFQGTISTINSEN